MSPKTSSLLRSLLAFALIFGSIDYGYRVYTRRHFIAPRKLAAAVQAGDHCLVFSGGSDLESALDLARLAAVVAAGRASCLADLTFGGTTPDLRFTAFRKYVSEGRHPSMLVMGFKGHDIVDKRDLYPGYYLGNEAAIYEWGKLSDFATYYPEPSMTALDNTVRFLIYRATAIGAHRESFWLKLELFEQRLGLLPPVQLNRFGNAEAFAELAAEQRAAALAAQDDQSHTAYQVAVWNGLLIDAADRAGADAISFVRLPALAASERAYFRDAAAAEHFERFMQELARAHRGQFIDLSHAPWVDDSLLADGLHYTERGRELISRAIAERLASSDAIPKPASP